MTDPVAAVINRTDAAGAFVYSEDEIVAVMRMLVLTSQADLGELPEATAKMMAEFVDTIGLDPSATVDDMSVALVEHLARQPLNTALMTELSAAIDAELTASDASARAAAGVTFAKFLDPASGRMSPRPASAAAPEGAVRSGPGARFVLEKKDPKSG